MNFLMHRSEIRKREMDALTARTLLFQRQLTIKNVDFSLPGVEGLDNQLAVIELGEAQLMQCNALAEKPDGKVDSTLLGAAAICKSLVLRETKERILTDNDAESVSMWGHTILGLLGDLVTEVSALSPSAKEAAKKNFPKTLENVSVTSSPEN
jgi:hypothetical protein